MEIDELLIKITDNGASDLHLRANSPPMFRINGTLVTQDGLPTLTAENTETIFKQVSTTEQQEAFATDLALDFAYSKPGLFRFRVSVIRQKGTLSLVFHKVPLDVPTIDEMQLPKIYKKLALKPRGLILVTGPTGNGKSTTLATMINHINMNTARSIISIEDPIEFVHQNKQSIIAQQELGDDTPSFASALVHSLRHNPDVIVVGEMRDLATISTVITAAETGHLVLGTLHTTDAIQSIDRVIDLFPPIQQQQIRQQLSQVLEAVLSQTLVPRNDDGRTAAVEILIANNAVRNLIREGKIYQIYSVMELGKKDGMQTLNQALAELVRKRIISPQEARIKSGNPEKLERLLYSV